MGFTLVELLAALAVTGILAVLLLPALGGSKKRAQGMQCLSNLRQVALGWQIYTDDSGGRFPVNGSTIGGRGAPVGEDPGNPSWVAGVLKTTSFSDNTNPDLLVGAAYGRYGSIGGYVKNFRVYHCPADPTVDPGNHQPRVRSISMNSWFNPGRTNTAATYWRMPFVKFTQSASFRGVPPAGVFVFLDENADSLNDGWFLMNMSGYNPDGSIDERLINLDDVPAAYHNSCSSFTFADGHAELHAWRGGSVMNDDDIVWLLTHATAPQ